MKRYGQRALTAMFKHSRWIAIVLMLLIVGLVLWLAWDEIWGAGQAAGADEPR